jgi:hypothetical protein
MLIAPASKRNTAGEEFIPKTDFRSWAGIKRLLP